MSQGRRIAAVLAVTAVATVGAAATAPALSVTGTTTPTVSTPTVTVPPVSTPVVTTPTVTVPSATAPKVTTPPVKTKPSGGVQVSPPKVTPPKASPPTVNSAPPKSGGSGGGGGTTVKTPLGSVNVGGGGGGSSSGSGSGGIVNTVKQLPGTVSGGTSSGGYTSSGPGNTALTPFAGGTSGGGPGGGLAAPGGFAGSGGFGPGPGSPATLALGLPRSRGGSGGSGGVSAFAAAVGSLAGCFYALTPFEQQILTVRTGIDGRVPLSRTQVAAMLGTSTAAIGRTERSALRELRTAERTDGCMPLGIGGPATALTAFVGGPFGPVGVVTPGLPPSARTEPGSGPRETNLASTSFAEHLSLSDIDNEASLSVLVIIAVMLSCALGALFVEARRSVH